MAEHGSASAVGCGEDGCSCGSGRTLSDDERRLAWDVYNLPPYIVRNKSGNFTLADVVVGALRGEDPVHHEARTLMSTVTTTPRSRYTVSIIH